MKYMHMYLLLDVHVHVCVSLYWQNYVTMSDYVDGDDDDDKFIHLQST